MLHITVINLQLGYAPCTPDRFSKAEKNCSTLLCRNTK